VTYQTVEKVALLYKLTMKAYEEGAPASGRHASWKLALHIAIFVMGVFMMPPYFLYSAISCHLDNPTQTHPA
jgi:hypothetical protein